MFETKKKNNNKIDFKNILDKEYSTVIIKNVKKNTFFELQISDILRI